MKYLKNGIMVSIMGQVYKVQWTFSTNPDNEVLSVNQLTKEIRYNKWAEIVLAANNSGMTRAEFCKQNGINRKTFYYYQSKIRQSLGNSMASTEDVTFVEVPVVAEKTSAIAVAVIHIGNVSIDINDSISESTLMSIGRMIRNAL